MDLNINNRENWRTFLVRNRVTLGSNPWDKSHYPAVRDTFSLQRQVYKPSTGRNNPEKLTVAQVLFPAFYGTGSYIISVARARH
jgi:hypothetical protein